MEKLINYMTKQSPELMQCKLSEAQFDTIIPILSSLIKMKWEHQFRKHKVESIRSNIGYILMKLELQAKQVAPFILSLAKKEQHSNTRYFETLINICAAIGAENKKVTSFLAHIIEKCQFHSVPSPPSSHRDGNQHRLSAIALLALTRAGKEAYTHYARFMKSQCKPLRYSVIENVTKSEAHESERQKILLLGLIDKVKKIRALAWYGLTSERRPTKKLLRPLMHLYNRSQLFQKKQRWYRIQYLKVLRLDLLQKRAPNLVCKLALKALHTEPSAVTEEDCKYSLCSTLTNLLQENRKKFFPILYKLFTSSQKGKYIFLHSIQNVNKEEIKAAPQLMAFVKSEVGQLIQVKVSKKFMDRLFLYSSITQHSQEFQGLIISMLGHQAMNIKKQRFLLKVLTNSLKKLSVPLLVKNTPIFHKLLQQKDPRVKFMTLGLFKRIAPRSKKSIPLIRHQLSHPALHIKTRAAAVLSRYPKRSSDFLQAIFDELLKPSAPQKRTVFLIVIGKLARRNDIPLLQRLQREKKWSPWKRELQSTLQQIKQRGK
tara:strand:- start:10287 stop:11915 length:1629 start_codon:yes stop_codon:yes gene_type:complete